MINIWIMCASIVISREYRRVNNMHYHVVEFINGCLNEYDSGPFEEREDARIHLLETVNENNESEYRGHDYIQAGEDRYERGPFILKIEECGEDCKEGWY